IEIKGNLFLVSTTFGDHSLHHLLPTVDHSKLELLYPAFFETCEEFNIPFEFLSNWDLFKGKYLQLANKTPNTAQPGYKVKEH
ncbi:Cyt-b5-rp, partial [Halocaridina rubra]